MPNVLASWPLRSIIYVADLVIPWYWPINWFGMFIYQLLAFLATKSYSTNHSPQERLLFVLFTLHLPLSLWPRVVINLAMSYMYTPWLYSTFSPFAFSGRSAFRSSFLSVKANLPHFLTPPSLSLSSFCHGWMAFCVPRGGPSACIAAPWLGISACIPHQ